MLQGILRRAVVWGRIGSNPVPDVPKPARKSSRVVRPVAPVTVEAIRRRLPPRDATLVSVLAYAGLRPGEALALTWADVGRRTLVIDKALALGEVRQPKARRARTVTLLGPLASDLAEWRLACGRPRETEPVFPMRRGGPWTDSAYRNWRTRTFEPAAGKRLRPYDLRHSFASLLLAEGTNPVEVAEQLGHTLGTLVSNYAHVIEELRGQPRRSAEALIRRARDARVAQM